MTINVAKRSGSCNAANDLSISVPSKTKRPKC